MNTLTKTIISLGIAAPVFFQSSAQSVTTDHVSVHADGHSLTVSADLILDSLELKSNNQIFITPVVMTDGTMSMTLPSVLVNGRKMHLSYQRGALNGFDAIRSHDIINEVERKNGHSQTVGYSTRVAIDSSFDRQRSAIAFVIDSCGCGVDIANTVTPLIPLFENPYHQMQTAMITPAVTELPVSIHEGRARVQFEVDRTELHAELYVCRNGQRIDNRAQLAVIDDSVAYALTDPHVEIAGISVCGYASPESPYLHNDMLASGRSRSLAEYLAERYHLPKDKATYSAVPENWGEFRQQVVDSKEITEQQRADLLELIDRPAYSPGDYDAKETELRTSPRFATLYRTKILPEWFPRLRATTFAISTRLKSLDDEELAEVILSTPEKMSLNQMFRVARLYPEGSDEFNRVIEIALKHYPDDPTANLNAAAALIARGEYDAARPLLDKAGDSPEADNLRGILATRQGDYDEAARYFELAGSLPAARKNLELLK